MSQNASDHTSHYNLLVRLAKSESWVRGDSDATLREVTEAAAHTMGIERVNVWIFAEQRTKIRCIEHYDCSTREHSSGGAELSAADYPIYFQALNEERAIVAHDARLDPRTREFAPDYLKEHGITSMLDAPLHSGGEVIGIICHEHVGEKRVWSPDEQKLAGSLADLASLALESAERIHAEAALRQSERAKREIIAKALDAIVIVDERGIITDWNPRAETTFGWSQAEAIGMTLYDSVIPPRHHEEHRNGMKRYLEEGVGPILNRRIESTARDKQGREFPVELTVSPLIIGESHSFGAFIRDITDRVSAELEIHKLNTRLEEKVKDRTHQLEAAVLERERLLDDLQSSNVELLDRLCELEHKSETIRGDLERAQVIQRALLPADPPRVDGVHIDALYRPGMSVGGDLYDVTMLADGRLALYIADAAGHGVAAAMLSVLFKQRLRMCDKEGHSLPPSEVLRRINAQLSDDVLKQGLFLTACYVLLDPKTGELLVASAGHPPMFLMRANGERTLLKHTGPALGIVEAAEFTEHHLRLCQGDRFILYTDGLVEGLVSGEDEEIERLLTPAVTGASEEGHERLRALYRDIGRRTMRGANSGGPDDVTLLMVEARSGASIFDNDPHDEVEAEASDAAPEGTPSPVLWIAESDAETRLSVRGYGTWLHCENFRRLAQSALDAGRTLTVDLGRCKQLDSAFLGTLHDIIASNPDTDSTVRDASVSVRGLFVELGLESILRVLQEGPCAPMPTPPVPVTQDPPERASQERLLRAHEILSELNDENRERFANVVKTLRGELDSEP